MGARWSAVRRCCTYSSMGESERDKETKRRARPLLEWVRSNSGVGGIWIRATGLNPHVATRCK